MDQMPQYLQHMQERLLMFDDKREMLEELVQIGKQLEGLPNELLTDEHFVPGCMSRVHIIAECKEDKIYFRGNADALIVKGYVYILTQALSGLSAKQIAEEIEPFIQQFIKNTGISTSSLASRANAFGNIFNFMQKLAKNLM